LPINLVWNAPDGAGGFVPRIVTGRIDSTISRRALVQVGRWRRRLRANAEDDADWEWAEFVKECSRSKESGYAHYALWALRRLQALTILDVSGGRHRTRATNLPQVYVEYLSVAPDNRSTVCSPRRVVGCGSALLRIAARESFLRGWKGRVALHSLPGAIAFYRKQGFVDWGRDPREEGCHYMELPGML
jgi:GNAT superfamily N-acetyltransferase